MPELAEVEFFRKQWDPLLNQTIQRVSTTPQARIYRKSDAALIEDKLLGNQFLDSQAKAKQMCFFTQNKLALGIHLGMTGKLFHFPLPYSAQKWDHLVLYTSSYALVFRDPRQFGLVLLEQQVPPTWWSKLPPELLSDAFNHEYFKAILSKRAKSKLKPLLLEQAYFPGIGNWMADEILWRSNIHPLRKACELSAREITTCFKHIKEVCKDAMEVIGKDFSKPPQHWLFNHRWKEGGLCPKCKTRLIRQKIGGRTATFCPHDQK